MGVITAAFTDGAEGRLMLARDTNGQRGKSFTSAVEMASEQWTFHRVS